MYKQQKPLVSVIIPVYDQAQLLENCLNSVFNQTYKNLEVIVVDDGSSEDVFSVVKSYVLKGKLLFFRQKNRGQGAARNLGVNHASGEWLAFLDSDDVWFPNKIREQVALFSKYPGTSLFFCDAQVVKDGIDAGSFYADYCEYPDNQNMYRKLLRTNYIINSSVMVRRDVFSKLRGFDDREVFRRVEDYDLWLRIARIKRIVGLNKSLLAYRYPLPRNRPKRNIKKGLIRIYWKQLLTAPIGNKWLVYRQINKIRSMK